MKPILKSSVKKSPPQKTKEKKVLKVKSKSTTPDPNAEPKKVTVVNSKLTIVEY